MKLSLCIAVYNEEKNIRYPLDSAIDFVDEVIIVDGASTDKTVEVAKSYGKKVRIINSDNPVMFHKNKQKAIEAAKGEWILQLDADEELTKELKQEIVSLLHGSIVKNRTTIEQSNNRTMENPVAYWITRKNWFLMGFLMKGGQYPDYTIRLYKNGFAKFPCKDVHENVEIINQISNIKYKNDKLKIKNLNIENSLKNENLKLKIGFLQNPLLHYADPDFSRYLMRWDRYTTAEVDRMFDKSIIRNPQLNLNWFNYFVFKPISTFFIMYFRHKGFMDGFPGFVFALFSSIRFWVIYIKWRQKKY